MMTRFRFTILAILATMAALSSVLVAQATQPADLTARLEALVDKSYPNADEPGASVIVVADGKVVLCAGRGLANVKRSTANTADTIFRIGSITKQFTAVAVLQLVQQGKVKLDDPITKYVSDLDTRGKTITIEHLLTHTSGMPNYTAIPEFKEVRVRKMSPREIVALVDDHPLDFPPGARFKYSNTGYVLLGMLIEKASGQPYADYMAEHIFKPAGMTDTRYAANEFATDRHARGYEASQGGGFDDAAPLDISQPFSAGAIESTVGDLWKWTQTVTDGKLVDRKLLERAWTPFAPSAGKSIYGFGWEISRDRETPNERWIRHGGGINGFMSFAVWIPERKVFVAVLSNAAGPRSNPGQLSRQLALEALGRTPKERTARTLDEKTLEKYVGVYELSPRFKLTVTRDGTRIFIQGTNQSKAEVFAEADTRFFSKVVDAQFEFHVDGDHASSVTLFQNGREIEAKRIGD